MGAEKDYQRYLQSFLNIFIFIERIYLYASIINILKFKTKKGMRIKDQQLVFSEEEPTAGRGGYKSKNNGSIRSIF